MSSRTAAMPAAAQASSSRAPGAPETPIAPRSEPPASIIRPPPTAATPGRLRMPLCGRPGCVISASSVVFVRNETAVQGLGACHVRRVRAGEPIAQYDLHDAHAIGDRDGDLEAVRAATCE